jgi:hypothetical protein
VSVDNFPNFRNIHRMLCCPAVFQSIFVVPNQITPPVISTMLPCKFENTPLLHLFRHLVVDCISSRMYVKFGHCEVDYYPNCKLTCLIWFVRAVRIYVDFNMSENMTTASLVAKTAPHRLPDKRTKRRHGQFGRKWRTKNAQRH